MKNQALFFFLLLCTFSCNKNVEEPLTFEEKIIGEWQVNSFVINSCPDESDNVALVSSEDGCIEMMGETACISLKLLKNGQAELNNGDLGPSGSIVEMLAYEIDEANNQISLCYSEEECIVFSMKGDGLYNDMDEDGCICTFGFKKTDI